MEQPNSFGLGETLIILPNPVELIGNTNLGLDIEEAMKLPVSVFKPESRIEFKADEASHTKRADYIYYGDFRGKTLQYYVGVDISYINKEAIFWY